MGIVRAVCTSPAKGTQKTNVKSAEFIEDFGIKEDAHASRDCRWCIWRKSGGRGI